jgi:hypothetical protein
VSPAQVAARALEGVESGLNHVLADERARQIYDAVRRDLNEMLGINESSDPTGLRAASEIQKVPQNGGPSARPCE